MTAISVVVATCGRPGELRMCLESLLAQTLAADRIVVVDDAPGGIETPAVVHELAARSLIYLESPRRGLAAAHNRALPAVRSPLVAFTDDDVVAHRDWLERLATAFADDPLVACVTGRIVALELETLAQRWLDAYAGFDKGLQARVVDPLVAAREDPLFPFATGALGSGANMAFRTDWLIANGGFDELLGAGTRARGGDDLAAFFDVLVQGRRCAYEPEAVVMHRHARELAALERTVFGYGVGLGAYLVRALHKQPRLAWRAARRVRPALAHVMGGASPKNARLTAAYPARLRRREWLGMALGPFAYAASGRRTR